MDNLKEQYSLQKRLRSMAATGWHPIGTEAADELTRLTAENERLRKALDNISKTYEADASRLIHSNKRIVEIATAALEGLEGK